MSFNKILLMGNLTRDPELTYLPSNTPVVEIGIACNRKFRRKDGEMGEEVLFVDCRAYARTAEVINQYFKKGKPIFIEGRLQLDQWESNGQKRSKHRVFIESFEFVGDGGGGGGGSDNRGGGRSSSRNDSPPPTPDEDAMASDDIPF